MLLTGNVYISYMIIATLCARDTEKVASSCEICAANNGSRHTPGIPQVQPGRTTCAFCSGR